jgi:hypothetical protein
MGSYQGELKKSTSVNVLITMIDSTDHATGKTGLTLTMNLSKAGGAYSVVTPTVTERTFGGYQIAFDTNHTDTLGDLVLRVNSTGADTQEFKWQVRDYITGESDASIISSLSAIAGYLDTEVAAIKAKTDNLPSDPADASVITAATDTIIGYIDTEVAAIKAKTDLIPTEVETGYDLQESLRIILAAVAGKLSGAATTTVTIRDILDTKNRITATVDADGNRTAVTLDGT